MNDEDVEMQLAVELAKVEPTWRHAKIVANALLPVVREIADQRAAEELARMGDLLAKVHDQGPARRCRNRAAALRGATDG